MADTGRRQPAADEPVHSFPQNATMLASSAQRSMPEVAHGETKMGHGMTVTRYSEITKMPAHNGLQPLTDFRNRVMHASPQLDFHLLQLSPQQNDNSAGLCPASDGSSNGTPFSGGTDPVDPSDPLPSFSRRLFGRTGFGRAHSMLGEPGSKNSSSQSGSSNSCQPPPPQIAQQISAVNNCQNQGQSAANAQPSAAPNGQDVLDTIYGGIGGLLTGGTGTAVSVGALVGLLSQSVGHATQQGLAFLTSYHTCLASSGVGNAYNPYSPF
jgi:hypothetical protein